MITLVDLMDDLFLRELKQDPKKKGGKHEVGNGRQIQPEPTNEALQCLGDGVLKNQIRVEAKKNKPEGSKQDEPE